MNTHTLELDLSKDGLGAGLVRVGQGDKHGTTIKALIYDGGAEAALTGFTAYLEVLLPNKRNYYRAAAAISGNAATVTVDENKLCSVAGYTDEAYFAFEKDGVRYSTERFAIEILRCVTEGQKPAQSWDDAIDNLISRGNAAVRAANTAAGAANTAADAANKAAADAHTAAADAHTAADDAREATKRALSVIGSGTGGGADSAEVEKLKEDAATLATALVDLTDDYIVIDNTVFTPASRVISTDGGTIELDRASYENGIITLE